MVKFERAIFLSWYCSKGDCSYCFMSTQKMLIRNPRLSRRRRESIMAEAWLCRQFGWDIEFLSGGYESYTFEELKSVIKDVYGIYGKKLWLNVGVIKKEELIQIKPYIKGICGAVECINPRIHDEVCPSKPVSQIECMYKNCDELGLEKAMTIIIGLGEAISDFALLETFIEKNGVSKVIFYALNPHKGTRYTEGPDQKYYAEWIRKTRAAFPQIRIVAGTWVDRLEEVHLLLEAGADNITKFPALRFFGTKHAQKIEKEIRKAGKVFEGTFTELPFMDFREDIDEKVRKKIDQYLCRIRKSMISS